MKEIQIKITGKIAVCRKRYLISSNCNYSLVFDFDEEWENCQSKTARILFDGKALDLPFTGNSVELPKIPPCEEIAVGVYSDTLATTFAQLGCIVSCEDTECENIEPIPEIKYMKMIEQLKRLEKTVGIFKYAEKLFINFFDGEITTENNILKLGA